MTPIVKLLPRMFGRRLTPAQNEVLEAMVALDRDGDEADKLTAKRTLRALREEIEAANIEEMAELDTTETVALRRKMGQVMERNIDGVWQRETALMQVFLSGRLSGHDIAAERLYEIGQLYADCYEKVAGLRTAAKQEVRGAGGGAQEAIADAFQTITALRFRQEGRVVMALDWVCGLDMTPNQAAVAYRMNHRTVTKRVITGLIGAAENRGV